MQPLILPSPTVLFQLKKKKEKLEKKHVDLGYHLLLFLMAPVLVAGCFYFQRWCLHFDFFFTGSVVLNLNTMVMI